MQDGPLVVALHAVTRYDPESLLFPFPTWSVMVTITLNRAAKREFAIGTAIFFVASVWGMVYVSTWGRTADILQASYGPSVMLACGRGFVNPKAAEVPELAAFLQPDQHRDGPPLIDRFDCNQIPADVTLVPFTGIHQRTWHLFYVAGWVWRLFGVAWSSLTPLYGLLYGLSALAAYALFRLLMNPPIALSCAILFLVSPVQLHYLPRLRDFAKAPFMLFALFCLLLLLVYPRTWRRALWCGAAAGAAIGLATGFRAEAVMYVIVFVPAVLLFYRGWSWPAWGARLAATAAFALFFLAASWPVMMQFQTYGERTHPFLMGFGVFYDGRLGVENDVYQVAQTDLDTEALAMHNAHNLYLDSAAPPIIYETPGYEAVGDDYFFRNLLWTLPGDLATRTAAAALRVLDELRPNPSDYLPRGVANPFLEPVYRARVWLMDTLFSHTRYVALALVLILGALSPRLGLLMLYLMFCLAGMASVQFATRHYFHLEVIPIFVGGAVLYLAWRVCCLVRKSDRAWLAQHLGCRAWWFARLKYGVLFSVTSAALVLATLWGLRWHQDRQLHALFTSYETAERDTVWPTVADAGDKEKVRLACDPATFSKGLPEAGPEGFFQVDMLVIEMARTDHEVPMLFRYTADTSERDLSWHTSVPVSGSDTVRYYVPIYNAVWPTTPDTAAWGEIAPSWTRFEGIEMNTADLPQLKGIHRFRIAPGYTPLIMAVLEEGWEKQALWQRLTR